MTWLLSSNGHGMQVIWDDPLTSTSELYIEAGDHENLIHLHGDSIRELVGDLPHDVISAEKDYSRWFHN